MWSSYIIYTLSVVGFFHYPCPNFFLRISPKGQDIICLKDVELLLASLAQKIQSEKKLKSPLAHSPMDSHTAYTSYVHSLLCDPPPPYDPSAGLPLTHNAASDLGYLKMILSLNGHSTDYVKNAKSCLLYGARSHDTIESVIWRHAPKSLVYFMNWRVSQPPQLLTADGIVEYKYDYPEYNYMNVDAATSGYTPQSQFCGMEHGGALSSKTQPELSGELIELCQRWNDYTGSVVTG